MLKTTVFSAYNNTKKLLNSAGIKDYSFEARQIIRHITGYDNAKILANYNDELTPLQQTVLRNIVTKRCTHYPLQYILGYWSFYGIDFLVGEGVLVPRSDTELLVDTALEFLKDKPSAKVLDLCSGSGCIAIAIAKNADCKVCAVEKYDIAYDYLEKNIKKTNSLVKPIKADIFDFSPNDMFDIIVSNPPYVSAAEMDIIDIETSFEPDTALYGGEDGLLFYRKIANDYKKHINPGGMLAFEVGFSSADAVADIMKSAGFSNITIKNDLSGIQRVVFGTLKNI